VAESVPAAWSFALTQHASAVLIDIRKLGSDKLHDDVVRFLRALTLEVAAAVRQGKRPAGTQIKDGRYAVDVRQASMMIYYVLDAENRRLVVTNIVWA
jgi:hypothetical protein